MRLRAALFACAVGLVPASASAQTVTPIPRVPPLPAAPASPALEGPATLGDLLGKPITRVAVVLDGNIWDDVGAPAVKTVKAGDPLTPAVARRALAEVLSSGAFARGRVSATADGAGALVQVHVVPRKLVTRIRLDAHGARLDREELLGAAELSDGGEIVSADIDAISERIVRFCAQHGYPAARVDVQTRSSDDPSHTLVLVEVIPGPARVVDDRFFYVFGAQADRVASSTAGYAVKPGDRTDEAAMVSADLALEQSLHIAGWARAAVSHDLVWVGDPGQGQRVTLRVRVDTGPQQIARFEGNEHYDGDTLSAALGLDKETDRSPSHLADKLRVFYEKRGFLDVEVRTELRGAETDPVQALVFHVVEHGRARVAARRYPCLKLDAVRKLSSGGPRSPSEIGTEIESFLEEELPGAELFVDPDPRGVSAALGVEGAAAAGGTRAEPLELRADTTFVADTYDRAAEHVQELYRNEGFLHAQVGPVQVVRARCDPRSPPNRCVLLPMPAIPPRSAPTIRPDCPCRSPPSTRRSRAAPIRLTAWSARPRCRCAFR